MAGLCLSGRPGPLKEGLSPPLSGEPLKGSACFSHQMGISKGRQAYVSIRGRAMCVISLEAPEVRAMPPPSHWVLPEGRTMSLLSDRAY